MTKQHLHYTELDAEVAGGLGPGINYNHMREPALIGPLHYEFDGWMGDDIVTTAGFWLVTDRLARALQASDLSGYELAEVVVTKTSQFEHFYPGRELPTWQRLIPTGSVEAGDDIALVDWNDLLLSDKAMALLGQFTIAEAMLYERPLAQLLGKTPREDQNALSGMIVDLLAVLGRPLGDREADITLRSLFGTPENGDPLRVDGKVVEVHRFKTAHVSYIDSVLTKIMVRTQPESHGPAYAAPGAIIEGLPLDGTLQDVIDFLGDPVALGSRGDAANFAIGDHLVNVWFAPSSGKVGRITAMLKKP